MVWDRLTLTSVYFWSSIPDMERMVIFHVPHLGIWHRSWSSRPFTPH